MKKSGPLGDTLGCLQGLVKPPNFSLGIQPSRVSDIYSRVITIGPSSTDHPSVCLRPVLLYQSLHTCAVILVLNRMFSFYNIFVKT